MKRMLLLALAAMLALPAAAQFGRGPEIDFTAYTEADATLPGETLRVLFRFDLDDAYHVNAHEPLDEFLIGTELTLETGATPFTVERVVYPPAKEYESAFTEMPLLVYGPDFAIGALVATAEDTAPGDYELAGSLRFQACDDSTCLPPTTLDVSATVTVAAPGTAVVPQHEEQFALLDWSLDGGAGVVAAADGGGGDAGGGAAPSVLGMLVGALLGGVILNLMPCVLPVLSIKVISLLKSSGTSRAQQRLSGLAYTAGILASFLALAGVLLALRAAGEAVGWGFQLQAPWFVAALAYLLFAMALSLSGVVEFGGSLQRLGGKMGGGHGLSGSFFTGVLATIVATPCTAPFMGTAIGFALTQPAVVALAAFLALGLGLALPFLVIAFVPAFARVMPKPGNWMNTFKELLAFPLYLTVVWLLWVLTNQAGSNGLLLALVGLVVLAFALWLLRKAGPAHGAIALRGLAAASVVAALALLPFMQSAAPTAEAAAENGDYVPYTPANLEESLASGQPVFVNMTADWCITCKVNDRTALNTASVQAAFEEHDVIYVKGDWTNRNDAISAYLESFGRSGVPFYVLYLPGEAPQVLPQLLTPGIVTGPLEAWAAAK